MKFLIKTDEICWEDFEIVGVTTNTPDFGAGDGQVLVQGFHSAGLAGLNHLPAYSWKISPAIRHSCTISNTHFM